MSKSVELSSLNLVENISFILHRKRLKLDIPNYIWYYSTIFFKGTLVFNLQNYSTQNIKNDILSGALVAVALVPEAIAFSFIAGVSPVVGLYGAFIIGLIISLKFGGSDSTF